MMHLKQKENKNRLLLRRENRWPLKPENIWLRGLARRRESNLFFYKIEKKYKRIQK